MSLNKVTVEDINVKGKKVLVRCDFNVPLKRALSLTTIEFKQLFLQLTSL